MRGGRVSKQNDNRSLTRGTFSGMSKDTGSAAAWGAGVFTAARGTLEVTGAITNTGTLALTIAGASDKLLLDAASAASTATFSGSTGTLELGTSGTLTDRKSVV